MKKCQNLHKRGVQNKIFLIFFNFFRLKLNFVTKFALALLASSSVLIGPWCNWQHVGFWYRRVQVRALVGQQKGITRVIPFFVASTSSATEKDKLSHRKRQAQPLKKTSSATTPHKIKEICAALQSVFHVQVEDPHRIFIDLTNRKTAQLKFISKIGGRIFKESGRRKSVELKFNRTGLSTRAIDTISF